MSRTPRKRKKRKSSKKNYVVVSTKSYGNKLKGTRIYFEGRKPQKLNPDGSIKFGKHILETLSAKFQNFKWIITPATNSIETKWGVTRIRISEKLLSKMYQEEWSRSRDIKNDIVRRFFSITFPSYFSDGITQTYVPGTLAGMLDKKIVSRLSTEDRDVIRKFIPEFVATEAVGTVTLLKASAEIKTLKELATDFEKEIDKDHGESWWQDYIKANILLMQQGYIKALDKLNLAIGETKFPDFSLITHDNYLDILEIKKPDTQILKEDTGRGNFFWTTEVSKAIIQTENYIDNVSRHGDALRSHLKDKFNLETKALRPRGIILVGDTRRFASQKQRDDLRLLSQGIKNITILTYDELLTRLKNYIVVLEQFSKKLSRPRLPLKATKKKKPGK
ncbi:DUF4263 domain-containing protein [Deltaproteobacteria bacterium PRO3]|nr:DUF4263 domain-containing protein [Deltaproteobacteria bacterium PRO3]